MLQVPDGPEPDNLLQANGQLLEGGWGGYYRCRAFLVPNRGGDDGWHRTEPTTVGDG